MNGNYGGNPLIKRSEVNGQTSVSSSNISPLHWMYREEHLWTHNASNFEVNKLHQKEVKPSVAPVRQEEETKITICYGSKHWTRVDWKEKTLPCLMSLEFYSVIWMVGVNNMKVSIYPAFHQWFRLLLEVGGGMGNISLVYIGTVGTTNKITFKCLSVIADHLPQFTASSGSQFQQDNVPYYE